MWIVWGAVQVRWGIVGVLALVAGFGATSARAECKLILFNLPITLEGREALTTLKVNGQEARFTIDSGAFFSMITPGWASQFGLKPFNAPFGFEVRGVGGSMTPQIVRVKNLGISGVPLTNVEFLVDDNEVGQAGLVGQNILGQLDAEYDFPHARLALIDDRGCEGRNLAYWTKPGEAFGVLTLEPIENPLQRRIVGHVKVNGVSLRALFDTGANSSTLGIEAARRAGVPLKGEGVSAAGATRGIGQRIVQTRVSPIREFAIDSEVIRNTRMQVGEIGLGLDMLVGADFFLAHRVFVSNREHKLFFTYAGGPVFNLTAPPQAAPAASSVASEAEPGNAADWARRASVRFARQDYAGAKTDLDKAVALSPIVSDYRLQRAKASLGLRRLDEAQADLDSAAALAPGDPEVRLWRARVRIARKSFPEARSDLAAAEAGLAPQADERYVVGALRIAARDPADAIADLDAWLRFHPSDNRRSGAMGNRCWARVIAGTDLDKARADCEAAHRAMPRSERVLVIRAFLDLRQGGREAAGADLAAADAINAKATARLWTNGLEQMPWAREAADGLSPKEPAKAPEPIVIDDDDD